MPYVSRDIYGWYFYSYGSVVLAQFLNTVSTSATSPVKLFEFELKNKIQQGSQFTVSFDMRRAAGALTVNAQVYRNGVAIGTLFNTAGTTFENKSQNLTATNWRIGDKIQLYGYAASGANTLEATNFMIKGLGSQWENTYYLP